MRMHETNQLHQIKKRERLKTKIKWKRKEEKKNATGVIELLTFRAKSSYRVTS